MAVKDRKMDLKELLKLAQEANKDVNQWPEWKKNLTPTKYSSDIKFNCASNNSSK